MIQILEKKDTTSINQILRKLGYRGFMMEDSIPGTKFWGGFGNLRTPCLTSGTGDTDNGDELTYQVETGKKCEYVKFATMCFEPYKSVVSSFKNAGFDIGNSLVPIVPKSKGSSNHDIPAEFDFTSVKNGFRLSIFVNHQPTGLLYHILLEPEKK